jgi:hypothetical protein
MAFSQSIRKGQTALVCQLCENDPKIKWKDNYVNIYILEFPLTKYNAIFFNMVKFTGLIFKINHKYFKYLVFILLFCSKTGPHCILSKEIPKYKCLHNCPVPPTINKYISCTYLYYHMLKVNI